MYTDNYAYVAHTQLAGVLTVAAVSGLETYFSGGVGEFHIYGITMPYDIYLQQKTG